jgi:hypothetical protein
MLPTFFCSKIASRRLVKSVVFEMRSVRAIEYLPAPPRPARAAQVRARARVRAGA